METQIVKIENAGLVSDKINAAASILKQGGLVAFPTETVYGIGANALNTEAVLNIYKAKGRPSDNPLIIHIAKKEDVYLYASDVSNEALRLMDMFWPGPLTLIFKKKDIISKTITGGLETVAIRLPSNDIARKIIEASGCPIAAPSANRSGRPSPTRAEHVIEDLDGRVDMIIDGGKSKIGLESTVLDVSTQIPIILRPGYITREMIEQVIDYVLIDKALIKEDEKIVPKAPGMKYKHYAPKGNLTVVDSTPKKAALWINEQVKEKEDSGYKAAVISTMEDQSLYKCENIMVIGSENDNNEIAANLFKILRQMDAKEIDYIYTRTFSDAAIGMATMNRLMKAAGNEKVSL